MADAGHAEADGRGVGSGLPHGVEFLAGGGEGGVDRGDLTEPAPLFGLQESVCPQRPCSDD
jgi:hypothetical protein